MVERPPAARSGAERTRPLGPASGASHERSSVWTNVAVASVLAAGVMHFVVAPPHLLESRAHGMFFLVLAFLQVLWAVFFHRRATLGLAYAGVILTVAPVVIWVMTRVVRAPFADHHEDVDVFGSATQLVELAAVVTLLVIATRLQHPVSLPTSSRVARPLLAVVAGFIAAGAVYGAGLALEDTVSWLGEPDVGHQHDAGEEGAMEPTSTEHEGHGGGASGSMVFLHENPFHIAPERISAEAGDTLQLRINNTGQAQHDFVVCAEPGERTDPCATRRAFTPLIPVGTIVELEVTVTEAGLYEYFCSVPGHREAGMRGFLDVEDDDHDLPGFGAWAAFGAAFAAAGIALRRRTA